jgi:glycosyltransferase involved in cell wall biosynthesis
MRISFTQEGAQKTAEIREAQFLHLLLVAGHPPFKDPRIRWQVCGASPEHAFVTIGLHQTNEPDTAFALNRPFSQVLEVVDDRYGLFGRPREAEACWSKSLLAVSLEWVLCSLVFDAESPVLDAYQIPKERRPAFRAIVRHFLSTAWRLVALGSGLSQVSSVIAADLDSLLAGVVLKHTHRVPLVYDAHEAWTEAFQDHSEPERVFWRAFEALLCREADQCFIPSDLLARELEKRYGVPFAVLPNAEPLISGYLANTGHPHADRPPIFLFQGIVSPHRGLMLLIDAWHHLQSDALLLIRGPSNDEQYFAQLQAHAGTILDKKIFFPPPVSEDALVEMCAQADVGVISYEPVNLNNYGSCPNKLSQYMAAGLPILSNQLPCIEEVIRSGHCGVAVDFTDATALAAAIDRLTVDHAWRRQLGHHAQRYFSETFHWEKVSVGFYRFLEQHGVPLAMGRATFSYRPPTVDAHQLFAHLKAQCGLRELFPLQDTGLDALADENDLIRTSQHPMLQFVPQEDGRFAATLLLPRVVDVTHVLLVFEAPALPRALQVTAFNEGGVCGEQVVSNNRSAACLVGLAGNPTKSITVSINACEAADGPPQITHIACLSYGIVRKSAA